MEAGERLGFLPGDMLAKVDPYLRPLYDALYDMLEPEVVARSMERGTIEVAPLAYMRGRTLNDSFIILDEAQNTTPEQMKMFLTRLGFGSKTVVTGDVTQIDLPDGRHRSGLLQVRDVLDGIEGLVFVELGSRRRGAPSHRAGDRRRVRPPRRRATEDRDETAEHETRSMNVEAVPTVFGADEQRDVPVDVARWVRLAQLVLDEERVDRAARRRHRDVAAVRRHDDDLRAQRAVPRRRPARPTCSPSRSTTSCRRRVASPIRAAGARARRPIRPIRRRCSATWSCARRSRAARPRSAACRTDDELALLVVHGVLHLLDYDHAEPNEGVVMRRREQELLGALSRDRKRRAVKPSMNSQVAALIALIVVAVWRSRRCSRWRRPPSCTRAESG